MWYVLDASDGSLCVVHEKNILQAGERIGLEDEVTFFYQGKEYTGLVKFKDPDHDKCNDELKRLAKLPKAKASEKPSDPPSNKLRCNVRQFYGSSSNPRNESCPPPKKVKVQAPKMTEAEKARQRILDLNKKQAQRQANRNILDRTLNSKKDGNNSDVDWVPGVDDEASQDSVVDIHTQKTVLKDNQNELLRDLNNEPFTPERSEDDPFTDQANRSGSPMRNQSVQPQSTSPSKADLMKQIQLLQEMLKKKDKPSSLPSPNIRSQDKRKNNEGSGSKKRDQSSKKKDQLSPLPGSSNADVDGHTQDKEGTENKEHDLSHNDILSLDEPSSGHTKEKEEEMDLDLSVDVDKFSDESLQYQLYGNTSDTTELGRSIFCKKDVLTKALTNSKNINHMLRRLMEGVFIPSKILNCTVTGQAWRAGGESKSKESKDPLHSGALKTIVDFSNGVGRKRQWRQKKFDKCKPVFAGRLIELKKLVKEGKLKD